MDRKPKTSAAQGRRITRHEPPVLAEAIAAAQGLTDHVESQVEIAAQLMGLSEDEVRQEILKTAPQPRANNVRAPARQERRPEVVVVQRRSARPIMR